MTDNKEALLDQLIETAMSAPGTRMPASDALQVAARSIGADSADTLGEELELAAAAAMLASLPASARQPLPAHLRERLAAQGAKTIAVPGNSKVTDIASRRAPAPGAEPAGGNRWFAGAGWAAAAALLITLVLQPSGPGNEGSAPDPASLRSELLQRPGSVNLPWAPSDIEQFAGVSGDVVWNNDTQSGYLRLVGMPANDPSQAQYQLWIVDPERDERPIDGGVFDVVSANAEVLIPIDAKLKVLSPAAFAITREKPGGVVVSAGPLLLVAAAG